MHLLGFCQADVLPPLRTLTSNQVQAVSKELAALKRVLGQEGYTMTGPASTVSIPTRETRHPVKDAGLRDTVPVRGDRQS